MKQNRNNAIPASYLILIKDNKTLLLRRFNTGYEDGNYSLIAGHVESGESFTQCIIREAKEEAGIIINEKDVNVCHVMYRKKNDEFEQRIEVFYTSNKWSGLIQNMEIDKCDDLSWFEIGDLPENIIPYIKEAINKANNRKSFSEYGWD